MHTLSVCHTNLIDANKRLFSFLAIISLLTGEVQILRSSHLRAAIISLLKTSKFIVDCEE